jgi:hypothetical protein
MEGIMKCSEIDIIEYIEGTTSGETAKHIKTCKVCRDEVSKIQSLTAHYKESKKLEKELDERLKSIDISKMENLPDNIVKKIAELKEISLVSKLKRVIGKGKRGTERLMEGFLTSRMEAMPASPKDITRTKKTKKKKNIK